MSWCRKAVLFRQKIPRNLQKLLELINELIKVACKLNMQNHFISIYKQMTIWTSKLEITIAQKMKYLTVSLTKPV